MARVLIVDADGFAAQSLSRLLGTRGFESVVVGDGPAALADFDRSGTDIVLLDVLLPGMDGLQVCRELHTRRRVPIIMVTGRDSEIDRVVGLEIGADDYVTKPYSVRELIARMDAVLRRSGYRRPREDLVLTAGPVQMNLSRHEVTVRDHEVALPLKEFQLLEALLRDAGQVVARDQLMNQVWGPSYDGNSKTLDEHVKRLRDKIEQDPARPRHLLTVRGAGYIIDTRPGGRVAHRGE